MAPNTYDVLKHHVGLKQKGTATNYGFMLAGSYTKEMQREALGAPSFGGSTDLIGQAPSLSRWTQDDFIGGDGAYLWGADDAMFAECSGFLPSQRDKTAITVPPLYLKAHKDISSDTNYVSDGSYRTPVAVFLVDTYIFVFFRHGCYRYDIGAGTYSSLVTCASLTSDSASYFIDAQWDSNDQKIYALCNSPSGTNIPYIQRLKIDLTEPSNQQTYIFGAENDGQVAKGLQIHDQYVVCGVGHNVYTLTPPIDTSSAVTATATVAKIGRLPGPWIDSCIMGGLTYILCGGEGYSTHVMAFDGQALLPVVDFPFAFAGKAMVTYGGRFFVAGVGSDVNGSDWYAELYEVTGASVRLVRSFQPEVLRSGADWPRKFGCLAVHEGLLWMCFKGTRLIAYDLTSDAFWGGPEFQSASDVDATHMVAGRGRLWLWGKSDASGTTKDGIYRIAQPADEGSISAYTPKLTTSDFAFEPAMRKRWSQIHVLTKYEGLSKIEASLDAGGTWTDLTVNVSNQGAMYHNYASLVSLAAGEHIRFRYTFAPGTDTDIFRELVAYTVSFAMLDSGKRGWSFVINASEAVEGRDLTTVSQDLGDYATTLWGWATGQTSLTFTDLDGTTADVNIVGFREHQPVIGPNISGEARPEAHFVINLVEV